MPDYRARCAAVDAASYLLLVTLIRNGTLSQGEVEAMARQLVHDGEAEAAHEIRAALIEAAAGDDADWQRTRLSIVSDGGNSGGT